MPRGKFTTLLPCEPLLNRETDKAGSTESLSTRVAFQRFILVTSCRAIKTFAQAKGSGGNSKVDEIN